METLFVREILLLNKSGLPIISRVYNYKPENDDDILDGSGESENDPLLMSALVSAIMQFVEYIGKNLKINDIGLTESRRMFLRLEGELICLITIESTSGMIYNDPLQVEIINTISERIFETIKMITNPFITNDGLINNELTFSMENNISIYPPPEGLGKIIDNIVMETITMMTLTDEDIDQAIDSMVEFDTTYLSPTFHGKDIDLDLQMPKYKNLFGTNNDSLLEEEE